LQFKSAIEGGSVKVIKEEGSRPIMKRVVHYKRETLVYCEVGQSAFCQVIDHPMLGNNKERGVQTSEVIRLLKDGGFETLNNVYKPEQTDAEGFLSKAVP
jgi:hypothetical protein